MGGGVINTKLTIFISLSQSFAWTYEWVVKQGSVFWVRLKNQKSALLPV